MSFSHDNVLTDARVVVDDGKDAIASFLHVRVRADASEERGETETRPGFTARFPVEKGEGQHRLYSNNSIGRHSCI